MESAPTSEGAPGRSRSHGRHGKRLFPFAPCSLITLHCLMAGGTDRKSQRSVPRPLQLHPQQDKATASHRTSPGRDVRAPIFLGGQGDVGPPDRLRNGHRNVFRGDCPEGGKLIHSGSGTNRDAPFYPGLYGSVNRRIQNNLTYLANLLALKQWYAHARHPFWAGDALGEPLYRGALETLERALRERLKRLDELEEKMDGSLAAAGTYLKGDKKKDRRRTEKFPDRWPEIQCLSHRIEESLGLEDRRLKLQKRPRNMKIPPHDQGIDARSRRCRRALASAYRRRITARHGLPDRENGQTVREFSCRSIPLAKMFFLSPDGRLHRRRSERLLPLLGDSLPALPATFSAAWRVFLPSGALRQERLQGLRIF